jgi:hypothetical protein
MDLRESECDIMGWIELAQHIPVRFSHNSGELLGSIKTEKLFLPYFTKIQINHEFLCRHTLIQNKP